MLRINSKRGALELSRVSRFVCAMFALGVIAPVLMAQTTPVAAYKVDPFSSAAAGSSIEAGGVVVGQNYTFVLCEASGREMLCGLSPASAGSQDGDTALTAVGFAKQERSQLLGSCLQFTEQVGDTPVLCTVGVTASMYTVELGNGNVQQVAGEESIRPIRRLRGPSSFEACMRWRSSTSRRPARHTSSSAWRTKTGR